MSKVVSAIPQPMFVCDGIVARQSEYAPDTRIEPHAHAWAYLTLVLDGVVEENTMDGDSIRKPGDVRVMPAGVVHRSRYTSAGASSFIVELHPSATADFDACSALLENGTSFRAGSDVSRIAQRMYCEFRDPDRFAALAVDGMLKQALVTGARVDSVSCDATHAPLWIRQVRERLHDEFPHAATLRELADDAGVDPSHLVRTFRRYFRTTPGEYVARLRIEYACRALRFTTRAISDIALATGFSDQAHFTRRFRTAMSITPARYRAGWTRTVNDLPFRSTSRITIRSS